MKARLGKTDIAVNALVLLTFVFSFHLIVHLVGTYLIIQLPYSWRLGFSGVDQPLPVFTLMVFISLLAALWALIRLLALPRKTIPLVVLFSIPLAMSLGTASYAHYAGRSAILGLNMLVEELDVTNRYLDHMERTGENAPPHIIESKRMLEKHLRE